MRMLFNMLIPKHTDQAGLFGVCRSLLTAYNVEACESLQGDGENFSHYDEKARTELIDNISDLQLKLSTLELESSRRELVGVMASDDMLTLFIDYDPLSEPFVHVYPPQQL